MSKPRVATMAERKRFQREDLRDMQGVLRQMLAALRIMESVSQNDSNASQAGCLCDGVVVLLTATARQYEKEIAEEKARQVNLNKFIVDEIAKAKSKLRSRRTK